jgi:hypothetical protein
MNIDEDPYEFHINEKSEDAKYFDKLEGIDTSTPKISNPKYVDSRNPSVQNVGNKILNSAIEQSKEKSSPPNEYLQLSLDHIKEYEFAEIISKKFELYKLEVQQSIRDDCSAEFRSIALKEITKEVREEVESALKAEHTLKYRPIIERSVKIQLEKEFNISIKPGLTKKLREDLEREIKKSLKEELMKDPDFINEVRSDLKRIILGL